MNKPLKKEIEKYIEARPQIKEAIESEKISAEIIEKIDKKLIKGIKEIIIKNETIIIKTKSPSWRQEIGFFKKEIIEKIDKKSRNYSIKKITIL
tara:strand:+ start:500 stop:781 length:282 start_codon:yes stop_codon:yes gene_type:complete